jgi:hypothetical protein
MLYSTCCMQSEYQQVCRVLKIKCYAALLHVVCKNYCPITGPDGTSVLEGDGWSAPRPGRFTPGKDPVPIVQEAGWAPGPVWTCAENPASIGIRSPDRPARIQSLYQLSYPGPLCQMCFAKIESRFTHRLMSVCLQECHPAVSVFRSVILQ